MYAKGKQKSSSTVKTKLTLKRQKVSIDLL